MLRPLAKTFIILLTATALAAMAALATTATTASATDYHRSYRAVESSDARHHRKATRGYRNQRYYTRNRGHRRYSPPRRRSHRHYAYRGYATPRYTSRYVFVISPDGAFRIARRYR